ncbi:nuclear migration protein [Ophiostoma piceae UAMH 11346]|uniref:Nuclear migration protein n=1 Tax=Ophiostoma piceae (strain UAMH 11346) TaxID=1262450 RepID=S3BZU4_OPHP1|nr:nuclear migration protein [Ophiostoma piceae UAMH 11346]
MSSMAVWETEDESDMPRIMAAAAAAALPTPTDTPYRTPSRRSRKSSRSTTPPRKGHSPPPMPGTDKTDRTDKSSKRSSKDITIDDTISILDPRRFTPTLHANLVAEILNLRRDQEDKMKFIDNLESALHTTRQEHESLQETNLATAKENRSLKRQLALLEGGTSSALGELAREREDAEETVGKVKKQLDTTQKRLRNHEEDTQRMHTMWEKEKESWEEEKRKFERKLHVADSRLKTVLEEVAAFHEAQAEGRNGHMTDGEDGDDTMVGKDGDAVSVRTMSMTNSIRFSVVPSKPNGNSLADELNFDGDETDETDTGGRESAMSLRLHNRSHSRDSTISRTHRRNQSNESLYRPGSVARGRFLNQAVLERLEGVTIEEGDEEQNSPSPTPRKAPKVEYTDSAAQWSPPPSPQLAPQAASPEPVPVVELQQAAAAATTTTVPPPVPARADRWSVQEGSIDGTVREWGEIEANQRRKRVHIARPLTIEPITVSSGLMVSVGSQTMNEEPLSPPKTPKSPPFERDQPKRTSLTAAVQKPLPAVPPMTESSTQTDPPTPPATPVPEVKELVPLSEMLIPSISIHPPTSRPTTPREPRLPPLVKDFGCQVEITVPIPSKSVSVQTDEIRVDKRLDRLPPHLHPSAITSRPTSPTAMIVNPAQAAVDDISRQFTPVPGNLPPRNPRRLASRGGTSNDPTSAPAAAPTSFVLEETHDAYPGNNDDGPLSSQRAPMRRPHRISSLFAGFDVGSSDEADEFADADLSDSEYRTALSAPKPKDSSSRSGGKRSSGVLSGTASPDLVQRGTVRNSLRMLGNIAATETYSKYSLPDSGNRDGRDSAASRHTSSSVRSSRLSFEKGSGSIMGASGNRSSVMRKAAMIQNGIATHQGRSRSPSLPDSRDPPFPIPTRASSRKPPTSFSAPSDGRGSPTRAVEAWHRRSGSRNHHRANSIRKVRSAAAIPVKPRTRRHGSRSPPPTHHIPDLFDEEPESPGLPPLPTNDITMPRYQASSAGGSRYRSSHHHQTSINTAITDLTNQGSVNSSSQATATGVVDAIAQTMVGEWMYKYVRRRKSFGAAETTGRDDSSNDRHKRWVWLAPYERAILWSSKQPSSNSTLMGKSGRKLTIQSVLDVKDDNPPPKGCTQLFNRSILILTPQRALKFTATTPERHYLWLTSLSFLAHSQQAIPENITAPPPPPKPLPDFDLARPKVRRGGIRDSIRLTKNKTAMVQSMSASSVAVPALPPLSIASSQVDSMPPSIPSYRPADSYRTAESYASAPSYRPAESYTSAPSVAASTSTHQRDTSRDTAEPPVIARFHDRASQVMVHGRKRSNTGGHVPPPLSFRGFSGPSGSNSSYYHASTNSTAGQSDISQSQASSWGVPVAPGSQRTSEASSRPSGPTMNNFFDAIGTMRMEAFISPLAFQQVDECPDEQEEMRYRARRRSKEMRRRASRSRHRDRDSYHSRGTRDDFYSGSRTGGEEDYFRDDPFKGF